MYSAVESELKSESRNKYSFTKTIIYTLVNCNATIFGGAVRDLFLHNFNATAFYDRFKNKNKNDENDDIDIDIDLIKKYNDPNIYPDTKDRLLVATDVDLFIKEKDFTKLLRILSIKYFIKKQKEIDMNYRLLNCEKGRYTLYKVEALNSFHVSVKLDIIVSSEGEPLIPLMETDFDVNRLMFNLKHQYYLRGKLGDQISFHNVIENIKHKRAICNPDIKQFRLDKMIQKGWNISVNYKIYNIIPCYIMEDKCIVCHCDFNKEYNNKYLCIVEFKCPCKYYVCCECIQTNGEKLNKCVMCREDNFDNYDNALNEWNFFKEHNLYSPTI
jgi:hypothetical protein